MADALQNFIDGTWVDARDGERFDVFNPATGEVIATAPDSKAADVDAAVDAARRAFDDGAWWPGTPARERGRILLRAADIVRREHERLARMESLDSGKPIGDARDDIDEVAFMFEYFGGWATKIDGDVQHLSRATRCSWCGRSRWASPPASRPWNYPMMMATQKLAPALAAGCTFVLKPPEQTPLTCLELPKILEEAGLPRGVFHVSPGSARPRARRSSRARRSTRWPSPGSREVGKIIMRSGRRHAEAGDARARRQVAEHRVRGRRSRDRRSRARRTACSGTRARSARPGRACSSSGSIYDDAVNAFVDRASRDRARRRARTRRPRWDRS